MCLWGGEARQNGIRSFVSKGATGWCRSRNGIHLHRVGPICESSGYSHIVVAVPGSILRTRRARLFRWLAMGGKSKTSGKSGYLSKSGRHGISMFDFINPLRLRRGSVGRPGWRRGGRGRACCWCLVSEAPCWRPLLVGWATYNIDRKAPGGGPEFIACTYVSRGPSLNLLIYFGALLNTLTGNPARAHRHLRPPSQQAKAEARMAAKVLQVPILPPRLPEDVRREATAYYVGKLIQWAKPVPKVSAKTRVNPTSTLAPSFGRRQ